MEFAKKSPFEDAGGAKGSQTELQLSPRGAQRRAKGAKSEPKGLPTGATFAIFLSYFLASFWDCFFDGFGMVLGPVLEHFGWSFWLLFWIFGTTAQPYENVVNSSQIEGGAPRKTTETLPRRQRKKGMRTNTKKN